MASLPWLRVVGLLLALCLGNGPVAAIEPVRVGSKTFTESYLLAEITAQFLESRGIPVERQAGLGGTLIAYEALRKGSIDLYPEYTGTLSQAVLQQPGISRSQLDAALQQQGLRLLLPWGFNNSYAMAINGALARSENISRVSDLARYPALDFGFSHEFLNRSDGWGALSAAYQLPQQAVGIEHALAYAAIASGHLDVTDAYSTDGELQVHDLVLLRDDRAFFPGYEAFLLARNDLPVAVAETLQLLAQRIDAPTMRALNYRVSHSGETPSAVASDFLRDSALANTAPRVAPTRTERILGNTAVHLKLTGIALLLGCAVAIPLALLLARFQRAARALLYLAGLIQTIPALALLALMIPLVGLGELTAILALFLYSLLPIVRNTLTGLFSVDPLLKQVATGMGLTPTQQLLRVELPLAMPTLLAGIKTAAIISIGTATLAAFVGAGGLGEPIISGLNLNDHGLILEGAIPAALLAIAAELLFELIERATIPAHLRN